jgi:hypothetical protein
MYKTEPVSFYTKLNGGSATLLGTSTFIDTVSAVYIATLATGTNEIYASWPGEGLYAPVTTSLDPVIVTMAAGYVLPGTMEITITPASGTRVVGEGAIDIEAFVNTTVQLTGNMLFYQGARQIGSIPIVNNLALLQNADLRAGTPTIRIVWGGGTIGGTTYQGISTSTSYTVLRGTTIPGNMTLSVSPSNTTQYEGDITLTAAISTTTDLPGTVYFSIGDTPLLYATMVDNSATIIVPNNYATGAYTMSAIWDGNQSSHPRYIEKTTTATFTTLERATLPKPTLTINPSPSAFKIETTFNATFNTTTNISGNISFIEDGAGVIGTAALVNNTAVLKTSSLTTGTKIVYAYYPGSTTDPKYFSTSSNTQTLVVNAGVSIGRPIILSVKPESVIQTTQYVVDEPIRFISTISTSTVLINNVKIFANNRYRSESPWIANVANTVTTIASTGTFDVFSYWVGGTIGGKDYEGFASSSTTITVQERATLPYNLNLTSSQNPNASGGVTTFTVTATTSTQLSGNVEFYFNQTTTTNIQIWGANNGVLDPLYPLDAEIQSNFNIPVGTSFTLTGTSTVYTVTSTRLNVFPSKIGEYLWDVQPYDTFLNSIPESPSSIAYLPSTGLRLLIGTSTFQAGVASLTVPANTIGAGTYTISAQWLGSSVMPKFYAKNTANTLTQTYFVAPAAQIMTMRSLLIGTTGTTTGTYITAPYSWNGSPVWGAPSETITLNDYQKFDYSYNYEVMGYPPIKYVGPAPIPLVYLFESQAQRNSTYHFPGITGAIKSQSNFPLTGSISVYDITSGSNTLLVTTSTFLTTSTIFPDNIGTELQRSPLPYAVNEQSAPAGDQISALAGYLVWPTLAQWYANWNVLPQINEGVRNIKIQYNGDVYNSSTYVTYNVEFKDVTAYNTITNLYPLDYRLTTIPNTIRSIPRIRSTDPVNLTFFTRAGSTLESSNKKVEWRKTSWAFQGGEYRLQTTFLGTATFSNTRYSGTNTDTTVFASTLSNITLTADNPYTSPYYHDLDYFNINGIDRADFLNLQTEAGYTNGYNTQGTDRSLNWNTHRLDATYIEMINDGGNVYPFVRTTSTFWIDSYDKVPTYWAGNTSKTRLDSQSIIINWNGNPGNLTMNTSYTGTSQLIGVDTLSSADRAGISLSGTVYAVYPNGSTVLGGGTV